MPASPEVMSLWSDPQACAEFALAGIDPEFASRTVVAQGGVFVAGENYGRGSSRGNAALELAVLGVDSVLADSFARIHRRNLVDFGVVPLTTRDGPASGFLPEGDAIAIDGLRDTVETGGSSVSIETAESATDVALAIADANREALLAGGRLGLVSNRVEGVLAVQSG